MHDTILLLMGVLPGVQVSYNGDEIGMENTAISWEQVVDPWAKSRGRQTYTGRTRDVSRTPIQWDSSCNAGNKDYMYSFSDISTINYNLLCTL